MPDSVTNKQILADPVTAYRNSCESTDESALTQLAALKNQHSALKKERKAAQDRCKQISRQIGEAKRQGWPVEELKSAMQSESELLKDITSRLTDTETGILARFSHGQKKPRARQQPPRDEPVTRQRCYPAQQVIKHSVKLNTGSLDSDAWNHYVKNNPAASVYHRAEWLALIHKTFGHQGFYFSAHDDNAKVVGILPLVRLSSRMFGDFMISMPYFNYGGAVADHPEIEENLMAAANKYADRLGVQHVEYRDNISRPGMPVRHDKVDMILKLPATVEDLWTGLGSKLRSQIRRAEKENPVIEIGGAERVKDFYSVFSRNMRDLGTPVYSKDLFSNIIATFPDDSWIITVKLQGKPVAGGFLISHGKRLEIPWASSIRDFNHLSVNMILYWETLRFAVSQGFQEFDFGRSSKDASTYRFKQQWGAEPEQLHWHYHLIKENTIPSISPNNTKYALMINTWKRLPVTLTQLLGPLIVRNIP